MSHTFLTQVKRIRFLVKGRWRRQIWIPSRVSSYDRSLTIDSQQKYRSISQAKTPRNNIPWIWALDNLVYIDELSESVRFRRIWKVLKVSTRIERVRRLRCARLSRHIRERVFRERELKCASSGHSAGCVKKKKKCTGQDQSNRCMRGG